jgi:hypothetical protein
MAGSWLYLHRIRLLIKSAHFQTKNPLSNKMIRDDSINRGTTLVAAVITVCRFFVIELQTDLPIHLPYNLSAIDCLSVRFNPGRPVSSTLFAYLVVICTRPLYKESLEMSRLSWGSGYFVYRPSGRLRYRSKETSSFFSSPRSPARDSR